MPVGDVVGVVVGVAGWHGGGGGRGRGSGVLALGVAVCVGCNKVKGTLSAAEHRLEQSGRARK